MYIYIYEYTRINVYYEYNACVYTYHLRVFSQTFMHVRACLSWWHARRKMPRVTWGLQKLPSEAKQAQILLKSSFDGPRYEDEATSTDLHNLLTEKSLHSFWRDGNKPTDSQCCVHSSSGPRAQGWNAAANGRDVYRLGWSRAGHVHKARLLKPPAEETGNIKDVMGQKNMQIISVLQHLYSHILSLIRQGPDWPGGRTTWSGPCGRAVKLKNLFEVLDTPKPKFIRQLDSLLVGTSLYDRATNANTKKSRRTFECILRGQQVIEREMPQSAQTDWSVRTLAITKTGYCIIVFQKNKDSNGKMDTQTEGGQTMNAGHTKCN